MALLLPAVGVCARLRPVDVPAQERAALRRRGAAGRGLVAAQRRGVAVFVGELEALGPGRGRGPGARGGCAVRGHQTLSTRAAGGCDATLRAAPRERLSASVRAPIREVSGAPFSRPLRSPPPSLARTSAPCCFRSPVCSP